MIHSVRLVDTVPFSRLPSYVVLIVVLGYVDFVRVCSRWVILVGTFLLVLVVALPRWVRVVEPRPSVPR